MKGKLTGRKGRMSKADGNRDVEKKMKVCSEQSTLRARGESRREVDRGT